MSQGDYLPDGEANFKGWLENFITQVGTYDAELGLSVPQYSALVALANSFNTDYATANTAYEAAKAATAEKVLSRKEVTAAVRSYAKLWKANPAISPGILNALGVVATTTSGPVTMVTFLNVTGCGDGVNKLTWNRNGNAQGTNFIIESKPEGATTWAFTASTTKTSFNHTNQIPGVEVFYRIISTRAGENAGPCPPVAAYPNAGDSELKLAA